MPISQEKFKSILADLVPTASFDVAAIEAKKRGVDVDVVLVDKNLVPDDYMGQLVSEALGYPFVRMENQTIPDHILRLLPERVARRSKLIAFGYDDRGYLKLAMKDPENLELRHLVEKRAGTRVMAFYTTERGIQIGLERYTKDLESDIKQLFVDNQSRIAALSGAEDDDDGTVIRIVELIMNYAYQNGASDVHIEPREDEVIVRYRIDGILHDVVTLPREVLDAVVTRIKILSKMRTDEHFAAQDGKFQEIINDERVDVRVSVLPIVNGEKIVMRLLTEKGKQFGLVDLGFSERDAATIHKHMQKSFGMILATGPTGSGKTTTMYAVLKELNTRDINIATIEDPIEYALEGINQIQVNPKTGLTFATGLRSIVRQDPDIIMVGEIRDEETAGIAVNAATTGHLVLSTLHTNDAATTLPRFLDMKVEPFLISSTVNVIIGQRLVRRICPRCIVSLDAKPDSLGADVPPEAVTKLFAGTKKKASIKIYKGKGCEKCNLTGYKGRIGIYEVLEIEDNIRDLVMKGSNARVIMDAAVKNGMSTMFDDGMRKVLAGQTTVEEVLRVTGV